MIARPCGYVGKLLSFVLNAEFEHLAHPHNPKANPWLVINVVKDGMLSGRI
jgi:hypothetical protein